MAHDTFGVADTMWTQLVEIKKAIEQYIRNQLEEDFSSDQISLTEYIDPFTGNKNM